MANIILIPCGAIRAPRVFELAAQLTALGHQVRCIPTKKSLVFITLFLLRRPSQFLPFIKILHTPFVELWSYVSGSAGKVNHISTSRWGDLIVVAPATCNTIGKIASGLSDSYPLLIIRAFESHRRVLIVPAMNPQMWSDPVTQENVKKLNLTAKYYVMLPGSGKTVSGEIGLGVMPEVGQIILEIQKMLPAD